ncbi:ribosomal protein L20 (plastid) [Cryptomonas paramecium]|uniref:50S ribosomal protein L20 n=1 Tax=Cryptomonas paramaecium TaxID=2898 RepID=D2IS88_9CRYP|nr:ribosomal protein L20 [Cryptomonas paramecium]ACT46780.1 ribosomal protein L20 [Cryptomonas paramecium]BDA98015.1 ribosomal protein L20 [Cryptomonas paramecium]|mmetsp:Transcript_40642/g.108996  ORF Transcript_40642/g.108996 Transcript_40642/m.108996 type:complete len:116 (+) Transcript_40642:1010-1357(+)
MTRTKRGNIARKRRKSILTAAKGFRGSHSKLFRIANQQVMKSLQYSYIGRKRRKREFRSLWITRINAAVRNHGLTYSSFISELKNHNIGLNRKMLCQMAIKDSEGFNKLIHITKH